MLDFLRESTPYWVYWFSFLGPFWQEDAAVAFAATASASKMGKTLPIFIAIYTGLFLSDIWKYWIGRLALKVPKFGAYAEKKHVGDLKDKVRDNLLTTLFAARFIPLTRIPAYVACGYFHINYLKFCFFIAVTAFVYVSLAFAICHALGELLGDKLKWALPAIGLPIVILYLGFMFWRARKAEKTSDPDTI